MRSALFLRLSLSTLWGEGHHDPAHFSVLKYPGEEFLAYYILLFPKPEALSAFRKGDLLEDDMGPEHLVVPTTNAYLSCAAAHICTVAWKKGAAFFGMDLFWHLIERIIYLATHGALSELYAEVSTPERELIATQFGFRREPDRPGCEPLFKTTLTPVIIRQWESNIRAHVSQRQLRTLVGV